MLRLAKQQQQQQNVVNFKPYPCIFVGGFFVLYILTLSVLMHTLQEENKLFQGQGVHCWIWHQGTRSQGVCFSFKSMLRSLILGL